MDILIQGNKLDFQLESEDNVLEVVESIEGWLNQNSEIIEEISIDGDIILPSQKEELANRPIADTKQIEITTSSQAEFALNSIYELDEYLERFIYQINHNLKEITSTDKKSELSDGAKWANEVVLHACRALSIDANMIFINELPLSDVISRHNIIIVELENHKYNPDVFNDLVSNKLKESLESIKSYLPKILSKAVFQYSSQSDLESENLRDMMTDLLVTISSFMPIIPEIGAKLQAGKEIEAYLEIKNVLGMMQNLVFYLRKLEDILDLKYASLEIDGINVDNLNKEFNELLNELSDAFSKKDIVLLGDLLEYESTEKLEKYRRIFEELIVIAEKKSYN